ncbi:MAG: cupin domain-containing protein [Lentisphaeria bacterium]|nr:cupin domain-containing protein [Lentisphaeria bacterium]MDY0175660.1 cupin domain-containing protein [Lentisphaeria bacterium]NLZ59106.1 cupin domain-containing protein [Lentisphaerota bacterium]
MKIIDVLQAPELPNPHKIKVSKLYDTEHAQVMHITLLPGEKLLRHITPVDVFFYVLQGSGTVEIGEEKEQVSKDMLIDSPAGIPHCWYNEGSENLRIMVVKIPRPTTSTKLL